ncbi:mitochondrial ATP synthase epsilon chain-domain-containing protein, partial [Lentinula edodes]
MSATWRGVFTFNKYSQITAGAVRKSLKESQRLAAEKRGITALRYQVWENGKGGEQV